MTPSDCRAWIAIFELSADSKNRRIQHVCQVFQAAAVEQIIASKTMAEIKYFFPSRDDTTDFMELAGRIDLVQAELSGIQRQYDHSTRRSPETILPQVQGSGASLQRGQGAIRNLVISWAPRIRVLGGSLNRHTCHSRP
jgi:hypothetical protein